MFKEKEYKRSGNLVYIRKPDFDELAYIKHLWSDYNTMKDIGGIYEFCERHKKTFYKKMISPTDGKNFYCLIYKNDGTRIGEVSFHGYDSANKIARLNVKVEAKYRGNGYGTEATRLLLEYYFYEFGGDVIVDTLKPNNKLGKYNIEKLGFIEIRPNSYRLKKCEFIDRRKISKLKVGIIAFDGVSISKLGFITEYLKKCNDEKLGSLSIDILSKQEEITSSINVKFVCDELLENKRNYDVIVFLDNIKILKELDSTKKIFRSMISQAKYVMAIDDAILVLLELEYLKGMDVNLPDKENKLYKKEVWGYTEVESNCIDNGKFILARGHIGVANGTFKLLEKIYGKDNLEKIKNKLE